jgi:phosphotransferase system  glucose/maltose/N-acetylglucosamine-specific IIC component
MYLGPVLVGTFFGYCSALLVGVHQQSWLAGIIVGVCVATIAAIALILMGYRHLHTDEYGEKE